MRRFLFAMLLLAAPAVAQEAPPEDEAVIIEILPAHLLFGGLIPPASPEIPVKPLFVFQGPALDTKILPIGLFEFDKSGNLVLKKRESWGWFQVAAFGSRHTVCDPFGRLDTECAAMLGPSASLETNGSVWSARASWSVRASGGLYRGPLVGHFADVVVRAAVSVGPVSIGPAVELSDRSWKHTVFSSGDTTLGTARTAQAGFVGLDLGVGRHDEPNIHLTAMAGLWASAYHGTLVVPDFSGSIALALDSFALARLRLEANSLPIGNRLELSGSVERTWAYLTEDNNTLSPAVGNVEWACALSASRLTWSPSPHTHLHLLFRISLTAKVPSQTRDSSVNLGFAWRFR